MRTSLPNAIKEVKRELQQRKKVYPRWIESGKLNKDRANNQYLALEAIGQILEKLTPEEWATLYHRPQRSTAKQGNLFEQ